MTKKHKAIITAIAEPTRKAFIEKHGRPPVLEMGVDSPDWHEVPWLADRRKIAEKLALWSECAAYHFFVYRQILTAPIAQ